MSRGGRRSGGRRGNGGGLDIMHDRSRAGAGSGGGGRSIERRSVSGGERARLVPVLFLLYIRWSVFEIHGVASLLSPTPRRRSNRLAPSCTFGTAACTVGRA